MKTVRASKSAAVIAITAKRSPIGNAIIFLTQRRWACGRSPRHSRAAPLLAASGARARGGSASASSSSTSSVSTGSVSRDAGRGPSNGSSSGGCGISAITWCWETGNEKSIAWRVVCSASAAPASSHTGSPVRLAPIARPANTTYSFERSKIESSQAPSLENWRV